MTKYANAKEDLTAWADENFNHSGGRIKVSEALKYVAETYPETPIGEVFDIIKALNKEYQDIFSWGA